MQRMTARIRPLIVSIAILCAVVGVGAAVADSANPKAPNPNTEANLTDAQRNQLYEQNWQQFQARYVQWVAALDLTKVNLRVLPRQPILADFVGPIDQNLAQATADADLAVRAEIVSIKPTAFDGTYVTIQVAGNLKGSAPAGTMVVHQGGGLRPTPDWNGMYIADSPDAPLMLPGDRVVLLLKQRSGIYEPESFTGLYRITAGRISAVPGNPFAGSIDGQSEPVFESSIVSPSHQ
jgi:hypothetical protein